MINMQFPLGAHREAVIARLGEYPLVLVPQDTTTLNYTGHCDTAGLGPIGSKSEDGPVGLGLHNSHAFTPDGVPLGVVSATCWAHDPAAHQTRREPDVRNSGRWLAAYQTLADLAPRVPQTTLVSIGDREADLFELFTLARDPHRPRLLVRANRGRQRQVMHDDQLTPLWDHLGGLAVAGRLALQLPRRGSQPARTAAVELRFGPVTLKPPQALKDAPLALWAVYLREAAPPPGVAGVNWLLMTNVATTTLAEAQERLRWYGARWGIEIYQTWCLRTDKVTWKKPRSPHRRRHDAVGARGVAPGVSRASAQARWHRPRSATDDGRHARPGVPAGGLCRAS